MTIYRKKVSVGQFLKKGTDINNGDRVVILNEGKKTPGEFGEQDIFLIKTEDGTEGNVSFNQTSINNLIDAYGEDSKNWINQEVKVEVVKQNVQGKIRPVYYFLYPATILDEESGEFIIPDKGKEPIPVIESEDEINPNEAAQLAAEQDKKNEA